MAQAQSEIRYLTPPTVDVKKKKYCRFKKSGRFFLLRFILLQFLKFGNLFRSHILILGQSLLYCRFSEQSSSYSHNNDNDDNNCTELELALVGAVTISSVLFVTSFEDQVTPLF